MEWVDAELAVPKHEDFYWVCRAGEVQLAYRHSYDGGRWQDPYTVGDAEGLSVEYYDDVSYWCPLTVPSVPRGERRFAGIDILLA